MKIAAIICEYNPFHNGHKYQIDTIKKEYDAVIAIMSGGFVQRGELAVFDKWTRARAALSSGVDLVIELPVCYALNTAERFAFGGVSIAIATGVVDCLCFGSESGKIDDFISAAQLLAGETPDISEKLRSLLGEGISYPAARSLAYKGKISDEILSEPNNILGLEYVRVLLQKQSNIRPVTIQRIGAGYNQTDYTEKINSASGIRLRMEQNEEYSRFIPQEVFSILQSADKFETENLFPYIKYAIISGGKDMISNINDVREGLENRIYDAAKESNSLTELLGLIKTKRYTMSNIKRILLSILLKLDKDMASGDPEYLRVLGMSDMGKDILRRMKERTRLPIVVKTADFSSAMFDKDILATDIAFLSRGGQIGKDYKTSPVIIK